VALVRFATDRPVPETRTLIESCREGWWYAAPLPDARLVVAFFADADALPHGVQARTRFFDRALRDTRLIAGVIQAVSASCPLHTVAAWSGRLRLNAGANWLAIGDAAQAYDPLSGQGIVKAIVSARQAADAIGAALSGSHTAIGELTRATELEYESYLIDRSAYYRRERRWLDHPFWQRRNAPRTPADRATTPAEA
jgi:flavin-dependent dehydrogenase